MLGFYQKMSSGVLLIQQLFQWFSGVEGFKLSWSMHTALWSCGNCFKASEACSLVTSSSQVMLWFRCSPAFLQEVLEVPKQDVLRNTTCRATSHLLHP